MTTPYNPTRIILTLLALLVLTACGGAETAGADPAKGKVIYETGGVSGVPCLTCHTLDGTALVGPSFQGIGERAGTRREGLTAEEYVRQSILAPSVFIVDGYEDTMSQVYATTLSEEDVENMIAFVLTH